MTYNNYTFKTIYNNNIHNTFIYNQQGQLVYTTRGSKNPTNTIKSAQRWVDLQILS